jgi:glycine betaine/proline transport system substrate-binding protein
MSRTFTNESPGGLHGWVAWHVRSALMFLALGAAMVAASVTMAAELPGKGAKVVACTSLSLEGLFKKIIVLKGLEKLGFTYDMPRTLSVPTEHQGVATGDCTYSFDHWVPMHDPMMTSIKSDAIVIGPAVENAAQGILIDKKTAEAHGITKLEQFKDPAIAKIFDTDGNGKANLCCTSPGWGAERVVNHLLDTIGLRDTVDHDQGEYVALVADVVARFRRGDPIMFYTWTPWWLLGELRPGEETVWLDVDPKYCEKDAPCGKSMTGFPVNDISIVANREFMEKHPAAKAFLEQVKIPIDDLNAQNLKMRNGEDKETDVMRHVEEWIAANQATFDSWVAKGMEAAN